MDDDEHVDALAQVSPCGKGSQDSNGPRAGRSKDKRLQIHRFRSLATKIWKDADVQVQVQFPFPPSRNTRPWLFWSLTASSRHRQMRTRNAPPCTRSPVALSRTTENRAQCKCSWLIKKRHSCIRFIHYKKKEACSLIRSRLIVASLSCKTCSRPSRSTDAYV